MNNYGISKTIFSKECILKIVYLWQKDFNITISEDEYNYIIQVKPNTPEAIFNWDDFNMQLQEQQLREQLNVQFSPLREAIYEKAFSHFKV